jgi:hypothetical protein
MSSSFTSSVSYTYADIEKVVRSFGTDMLMIADSTKAIEQQKARDFTADIECLAKHGYLKSVDVTLLDGLGNELRAVKYDVDTDAGSMSSNRPGNVLWPRTPEGSVRVIVRYTEAYNENARQALQGKLQLNWGPTSVDTSHATLRAGSGRDYASNGFGMQRKDFTQ